MNEVFENDPFVKVGRALLQTSRHRFQLCEALLEELGIGAGQMPVLGELQYHKQMTQRELAEHTHVTPATISGTLKRMERAGLIQRTDDESDARISIVTLTQKGIDCSNEAIRLFTQTDMQMLEGFTPEELDVAQRLLTRMNENLCTALKNRVCAAPKGE